MTKYKIIALSVALVAIASIKAVATNQGYAPGETCANDPTSLSWGCSFANGGTKAVGSGTFLRSGFPCSTRLVENHPQTCEENLGMEVGE